MPCCRHPIQAAAAAQQDKRTVSCSKRSQASAAAIPAAASVVVRAPSLVRANAAALPRRYCAPCRAAAATALAPEASRTATGRGINSKQQKQHAAGADVPRELRGLLTVVAEPVPVARRFPPAPLQGGGMSAAGVAGAVVAGGAIAALGTMLAGDADLSLLLKGRHRKDAFAGKVVWVTGASQGLGAEIALYLASQGARLILSARGEDRLKRVKAALVGAHASEALVLPLDVTAPPEALEAAAAAADAAFGGAGVDFLVHNAGASQHALAAETAAGVSRRLLELNALGAIALTRAALPRMLERNKGRLVVVASLAARIPSPGQTSYAAAKGALYAYFASLASEIADTNVGVTICCPGPISTGVPPASPSSTAAAAAGDGGAAGGAGGAAAGGAAAAAAPRVVYGAEGLIEAEGGSKGRVAPARCARLVADAMAHGVRECWIARQPILLLAYIMQYAPSLGAALMRRMGPPRARAVSSGRSGYDAAAFLRGKSESRRGGGGSGGGGGGGGSSSAAAAAGGGS